ncbi:hypothetical protein O6H91_21G059500 [Diphasiastrum complanatum]|uniref:Uncharacterized protein n=1 Tax=Diphasiastrum complanatum TaxID=34168 RepID=A0ACC2AKX2_DIPCM|nr:hypothetical protein O6H91_21G059500 [Diphasiastrum complanatum]
MAQDQVSKKYLYQGHVHGEAVSGIKLLALKIHDESKNFAGSAIVETSSAVLETITGTLYTDNLHELHNNTVSFKFKTEHDKFIVSFYDKHEKWLGVVEANPIKSVTVPGQGTGCWE